LSTLSLSLSHTHTHTAILHCPCSCAHPSHANPFVCHDVHVRAHMSADRRCVTAQLNALGVFVGVNGDAKERSLR